MGTCVEISGVESKFHSEEFVSVFSIPLGERALQV